MIKKGMLVAMVGIFGSGKSSFLSCVLGDMRKISGKVCYVLTLHLHSCLLSNLNAYAAQ